MDADQLIASEPDWRHFADYRPWTRNDCLIRIDVLADRPGVAPCSWGSVRAIITGTPLGARYTNAKDDVEYTRDPDNVMGLAVELDLDARSPEGAVDTSYRSGATELWIDPSEGTSIYLVESDHTERWPRVDNAQVCSWAMRPDDPQAPASSDSCAYHRWDRASRHGAAPLDRPRCVTSAYPVDSMGTVDLWARRTATKPRRRPACYPRIAPPERSPRSSVRSLCPTPNMTMTASVDACGGSSAGSSTRSPSDFRHSSACRRCGAALTVETYAGCGAGRRQATVVPTDTEARAT